LLVLDFVSFCFDIILYSLIRHLTRHLLTHYFFLSNIVYILFWFNNYCLVQLVCGFFPGMLPPIAPRDVESKFGPHVLVPRLPRLPRVLRFPMGELTLTDEGGIHISKSMYNMLIQFSPMLPVRF